MGVVRAMGLMLGVREDVKRNPKSLGYKVDVQCISVLTSKKTKKNK